MKPVVRYIIVRRLPFVVIEGWKSVRPNEIMDYRVLCLDLYYGSSVTNNPNMFGANVALVSGRNVCVLCVFNARV
jgi:hypothetical protein